MFKPAIEPQYRNLLAQNSFLVSRLTKSDMRGYKRFRGV
jgi:hypothetical protein